MVSNRRNGTAAGSPPADVPRLVVVSHRRLLPLPALVAAMRRMSASGVAFLLQLREKDLGAAELLEITRGLVAAARAAPGPGRAAVVVNGRFDVALAGGADGVHLPAAGPPAARVRAAVGDRLWIGASAHSPEEVRQAALGGADYVLFGPIYPTPSKEGMGGPQGLPGLRSAVAAAGEVPVLAIGGVDAARAACCRRAGAHGVAVIRAVLAAEDPAAAAWALIGGAA